MSQALHFSSCCIVLHYAAHTCGTLNGFKGIGPHFVNRSFPYMRCCVLKICLCLFRKLEPAILLAPEISHYLILLTTLFRNNSGDFDPEVAY